MIVDDYTPENDDRDPYGFANLKSGSSAWFATAEDRLTAYKAFKRWAERTGSTLEATTRKVGKSDPRGEGYRMHFKSVQAEARPIVASTVRKSTERAGYPVREYILTFTGLHTDDDVLSAVMSVDPTPTTISEANNACRLLWKGETPMQIEYCLQRYGRTFNEIAAEKRKEAEEQDHADAERKAANVIRLEDIKRQEAEALARLEKEIEQSA